MVARPSVVLSLGTAAILLARARPLGHLLRSPMDAYWGVDSGRTERDIACFVRVAARLSFSRAATELGMSQPAVSQAVARLERRLGLRLFERTSREVRLCDEGKLLLPYAEGL